MLIPPEKLSQLKSSVDIVEIISDYLPLKKVGKRFKALCPFHPDKDPSFYVNQERQNYRCFGCGVSGDAISFLQAMDHLSFPDAVRALARRAGVEIEISEPSGRTAAILKANEFACKYYEHVLLNENDGKPAREYLERRKITTESVKKFRLGYAPPGWESLKTEAGAQGVAQESLTEAGLLITSSRGTLIDFFRQRLMFPIFDTRSRVIAFGGRVLDDSLPKYINSPDTPLFKKSETLYGLNFAKAEMFAKRRTVVTEGYTDVIRAHEKGVASAVATLGTAFTESHARLLRRFVDTVYVVFDSDSAGRKAAERSLEILLGQELGIRIMQLTGGTDLCEYLADAAEEDFEQLREEAVEFLDFKYESVKARHDLTTTRGQAAAADELLGVLKSIANPVLRDLEVRRVATLIGTSEAGLRARLGRIGSGEKTAGILKNPATELVRDRDLIDILLNRPDMATRIMDAFPPESYSDEDYGLIASLIYDEYDEKGIISTDSIYKSVDGERLRGKVLEVLRYGGEHGDEERDYEKLFAAWAGRKEEELLANEIKKKKDEHPGESLVEYFKLKKKISQKHKV